MKRPLRLLTLLALAIATTACGSHHTYVKSDTALGRVVVYRNGIAYYERRARPTDDRLVLTVPQDKVDDFLKSLTVTDAASGATVPVSYPTRGASDGDQVAMMLQLPPGAGDELVITYITDAPAWKPSYRVVVGDDGEVAVQGWAIVDNTTGEDWNRVRVGVGASSAMSFRYDLRSVVHVHRETLGGQQAFAVAPPTGGAIGNGQATQNDGVALALSGEMLEERKVVSEIEQLAAMPARMEDDLDVITDASGRARATRAAASPQPSKQISPQAAAADQRLAGLAERVKSSRETVVVRGYHAPHEPAAAALEKANRVRNRLIELGVAPGRVEVQNKGHEAGKTGVEMSLTAAPVPGETGDPVGESHFESDAPMSIPRGTSAMVAVLDDDTAGRIAYLYDPDAERGDARYAFKAVRFQNPTESTLEAGPVTVYGARRFIGEGLTASIPPRATALVPYALDRQVTVDREATTHEAINRLTDVDGGVFTAELAHTRRTTFEVHNRGHEAVTVFLRHTLTDGWTLGRSPELFERQGESHLFTVDVEPGATREVMIEASTPLTRTLDLRAGAGVELLRDYLHSRPADERFADAVRTLLGLHDQMITHRARIDALRGQLVELRQRSGELTEQIERLDRTTVGLKLRAHLQQKLMDVSERIQKATVETVSLQEELMLGRIRFQDAAVELTLGRDPVEVATDARRG